MSLSLISNCRSIVAEAIAEIQQPRTDFELRHFVVGQHDTEPRRYAQCVLEMQIKLQALKRSRITQRQLKRRIQLLRAKGTPAARDRAAMLRIDLEDHELARLGAIRELAALHALFCEFPKRYTREELNAAECEYWRARLHRQAQQDVFAHGRIGVGNQDAIRMMGLSVPGQPSYIDGVQQRFLEAGKVRVLIAIPTLIDRATIQRDGLRCLDGWDLPGAIEKKKYIIDGRPIAEAYTDAARTALSDDADFMLTVEDDHIIPQGSFERLWDAYQHSGPRTIVGAWYPQKKDPRTGAPIAIRDGARSHLDDDGGLHEVHTVPQGFTLIPTRIFRDLPQPWFVTTGSLTQDSFFSQLAREAGYKLLVDTSCRIKHVCRETGRVYE